MSWEEVWIYLKHFVQQIFHNHFDIINLDNNKVAWLGGSERQIFGIVTTYGRFQGDLFEM